MLSFGLAVGGRFDGTEFEARDPSAQTFYRELAPISENFEPDALEVSGLDREGLMREGSRPEDAMTEAAAWVEEIAGADRPVLVAFPAAFDWLFLYWYFVRYSKKDRPSTFRPVSTSRRSSSSEAGVVLDRAGLGDLPPALQSDRPHTHNALDDAIEQGEIFQHLWSWHPKTGKQ